jgi:hypothetical protein
MGSLKGGVAQCRYFNRFCLVGIRTPAWTFESPNSGLRPLGPGLGALTIAVGGSL